MKRRAAIVFPDIDAVGHALGYGDNFLLREIDRELLAALAERAGLRDGERAVGVQINAALDALILYIEGGWLPLIPELAEGPQLHIVRVEPAVEVIAKSSYQPDF